MDPVGLRSITDHVPLAWSKPGATITTDLTGKDYDALTFRIVVVRPMGQEAFVTLTASTGKMATLTAMAGTHRAKLDIYSANFNRLTDPAAAGLADVRARLTADCMSIRMTKLAHSTNSKLM
ncbi:hypothetical protein [Phyllobacterium sp. UNC302MFCol5.2]|uniref:hypothetical protein n=1 Tax=Phyllobacterium sp. UNC302MFCol5.2 TaxID=1449065 RepID=UPI0004873B2E|nr:hypothetical protein [Phyllobacterium sp. UNC302MFCol5.2]